MRHWKRAIVGAMHNRLVAPLQQRLDTLRWRVAPPGDNTHQTDTLAQWHKEESARFRGWDFSHLEGRVEFPKPDWDYTDLAQRQLVHSHSVLDMATGGGEIYRTILASALPAMPTRRSACEGWRRNIPVARNTLKELGVDVHHARRVARLPFADASFDLILNRHGGFDALEVRRLLAPGGVFLTQQIGGDDLNDLCAHFGRTMRWHDRDHDGLRKRLVDVGLKVDQDRRWGGPVVFHDVGALVYYLCAVPWLVPGFRVSHFPQELLRLQQQIDVDGRLEFHSSRSLFIAHRA